MRKGILALLALTLGMTVFLAGCSKEAAPDPNDPNLSKNTGDPKMGGPGGEEPSAKPGGN